MRAHRDALAADLRFDLVILDLDGTLVDSLPDIKRALDLALAGRGLGPVALDEVRAMVGDGVAALVRRALVRAGAPAPDETVAGLAREMVEHYTRHPCVLSRPFPGVAAALDALFGLGCRLAVLTNKPGPVARALVDALGMRPRFADVLGDQDGLPRKPAPDGVHELVRRAATTPARTLMVGDGVPDVEVARAAGVAVAAVGWGYGDPVRLRALGPEFFLDDPAQLPALVTRAG